MALGSAMLLLSMIPAASAFAANAPAVTGVTLSSEQGTVAVGNKVSFTATAVQSGTGTPLYQFWYEGVNGNWHATGWSTSNTFSLPPLADGSYEVVAYAKDKGQVVPANSEGTNTNQFVNVGSSATLTAPSLTNVAPGTTLTFTAASKNLTDPVYQLWIQKPDGSWFASGNYQSSPTFQITAGLAGDYHAVLYAKDLNAPQTAAFSEYSKQNFDAYGQASAVKLSAASSSLVADGAATDTITATVVDSNGNTVSNFNGTATLTVPSKDGSVTSSTVNIKNGVGTATLTAPSSVPSSPGAITLSGLTPTAGTVLSGINYGTGITLSYTAAKATSLSLTPVLNAVSSNGNNPDTVNVQLLDQAGQLLPPGNGSAYVTFTISGPGSFADGSSQTTLSEYVTSGQTLPLTVYSIQGEPGAITISASGTGLTTASTTIQSESTTTATKAAITSQTETVPTGGMKVNGVALPAGWQYTVYTVQVEDANGVAVPSAQTFTLSDNTSPEALYYYGYKNNTVGNALSPLSVTTSSTTGQAQFAVFNTTAQSTPATITATDSSLPDSTATATYNFYVGSASTIGFNTAYSSVESGQSVTYTVQLKDAAGNNVATSGQTVDFYLSGNSTTGATINGSTGWTSGNPYTAVSNSQGQASVTVNVPSSSAAGDTYTVNAELPGQSSTLVNQTSTVVVPSDYAQEIGLSTKGTFKAGDTPSASVVTLPTSMSAGQTLVTALGLSSGTSVYGYAENNDAAVANTSDTLQITSSNPKVLAISGAPSGTTSIASGSALPTITAESSGTATLTIQDVSDPAMPKVSATIAVSVGSATQIVGVNPNNTTDTAYTFPSTSGLIGPFTLQVQDGGGNDVPLTNGPVTLTASQVDAILGLPTGTGIATSTTSGDVQYVTIGNDQSSVQVWVDNGSGALDSASTTATPAAALTTLAPTLKAMSVSGDTVTLTFTDPFTQSSANPAAFTATTSGGSTSPTTATVSGNTVTLTFTSAPSGTLTWTVDTATSTTPLTTAYGASLAAGSVTAPS